MMRHIAAHRMATQRRRMRVFYNFTYFDVRGLGEQIRLLLVDNDIYFEEKRIDDLTEWSQMKHRFAFNQLPCLQDDDVKIVQSATIMRHLARKHDLYGRNEDERVFLDVFYDCLRDVHAAYSRLINCEEENYEERRKLYIEKQAPAAWSKFEELLKDRNGPFILGDKIAFVDYALFEELDIHLIMSPTILEAFPKLRELHRHMNHRPSLQPYLNRRAAQGVQVNWNGRE